MKFEAKVLLCLMFCTVGIFNLYSQTAPPLTQVIPPSPNVQAMQKYGDIPVSAYTGIPNISIPLYTIKYHDITVPISVSYHASGIKVAEEASNVGLGWVLNAGGSISRNIIGNDDFLPGDPPYANYFDTPSFTFMDIADGLYPYPTNLQTGGQLTTKNNATSVITTTDISASLPGSGSSGTVIEFQPDQFYFNIPGLSGKFLLRRNGTAILQSQQKVDITHNGTGTVWDILTVDGFDYSFTELETSKAPGWLGDSHISAVYLTQIKSPEGNTVNYNYTEVQSNSIQSLGSYTESRNDVVVQDPSVASLSLSASPVQSTASPGGAQVYNSVYLSSIDYNTGRVMFNYTNDRTDSQSDNKLNSITVYNKDSQGNLINTPVKTIAFNYSYFSGTANPRLGFDSSPTFYWQRLQLNSITESGFNNGQVHTEKPYLFTYYYPTSGPSKSSLGRDNWGYNNGKPNTTLIPGFTHLSSSDYVGFPDASRNPDPYFMQMFTLSDIQYPTGGTTHFDYEANDCDEQNSEIHDHANYQNVFTIEQSPNTYPVTSWNYGQTANMPDVDLTDMYSAYSAGNNLSVAFVFTSNPQLSATGNIYVALTDQNNNLILTADAENSNAITNTNPLNGFTVISLTVPLNLAPGIYHVVVHVASAYNTGNLQHVSVNPTWYTRVTSNPAPGVTHPTTYSLAGGLRIKRITNSDGINPPSVKRYIYHRNVGQTPEYSYGIRMSRPEYSYWEQSEDIYSFSNGGNTGSLTPHSERVMRLSDSNIPLNGSAQGMVVGYTQVTENYGENGENGKTVYQYYNQPDNIPPFLSNNLPRKRPYNSDIPDPLNGSLLEQTDYKNVNGQFIPVKDITNSYSLSTANENVIYAVEDHIQLHCTYSNNALTGQNYTNTSLQDRLLNVYSPLQSDWTYLTATDEKDYSSDVTSNYAETITNYYYDNPGHYLPTRKVTTNSKGEIITEKTAYPLDFTNLNNVDAIAPGVINLNNHHMINTPVEKYVQKTASDGSNLRTVSASLTAYTATPAAPLPLTVYQLQSVVPVTNFTSYAASGSINSNYQPMLVFDKFDQTNGNLLQQHIVYGINYSYLWGYNKQYPIAQVVNAAQSDIFFDGFEEGDGNSAIGDAKTGHYSFSGNYSQALSGLDAGTYTLSYWSKSGSTWAFVVNNSVSVTGSAYTIALSGQIDDVRFYPSAAQMSSYTYDPGIGVTSITDPKSEITFYEYDGLGRLQNIKDKDGNIIKSFCYNFAGQAYGCGINQAPFTNDQQFGVFTVNNCTAGYTGSQVTYTVAAGKYVSTLSKADANQQAQNDVTQNGQAYANTNGTCLPNITFTITNRTNIPYEINFSSGSSSYTFDFGTVTNYPIYVPANAAYSLNVYPQTTSSTSYNITLGSRATVTAPRWLFSNVNISTGSSDLNLSIQ